MRIRYTLLCAILACGGCGLQAWAQAGAPAPVTIHVTVTDKAGNLVNGLHQSDFSVLDDQHSSPIQGFSASASAPPLIVLVMDQVNEPFRAITIEQEQLERFVSQNQGHLPYPVSLIFLTDAGLQQTKPTTDGNSLNALLTKHHADLRAIDASNDLYNEEARFQISLRALETILDYEAGYPGRKLLVWISQGWPSLNMPDDAMLSLKQQKKIFGTVVTTSNLLRFTNTTIYSVDPEGNYDVGAMHTVDWQQFVKPVPRFDKAQYGNLSTQVLSQQTGGLVRVGGNDVAQEISNCVQDAAGGYDLTFQPQAADQPNTWHALRVKVDRRGATVRTLNGYYAQP